VKLVSRFLWAGHAFGLRAGAQLMSFPLRKAYHTARCATPKRRGPALWLAAWRELRCKPEAPPPFSSNTRPGKVVAWSAGGQSVGLTCENATVHVTVLAADVLRVQLRRPGEGLDRFSYAVATPDAEYPLVDFAVTQGADAIDITTSRLVCRVKRETGRLSFLDLNGREIAADAGGLGWVGDSVSCSLRLAEDEHVYGLGEKAFGLDRRGRAYEMWNDDPNGAYGRGRDPIYLSIPFYIGLRRESAYGVFYDNTYRSRMDMGGSDPGAAVFQAGGGPLRYYVFYGPQVSTVVDRYTQLTGRMRMPPLWALGYQQSRWSYTPARRVDEIACEFRARRIPCDVIHLDIDYMDGYRCFTWHPQRFPDPVGLINGLHAQGFKVVPMIDCGIKVDRSYAVCQDGLDNHAFCAYPDGSLFRGPVWPGDSYFPDFTSPATRAWWGRQYRSLVDLGADGVWNDMNEPTVFGWSSDTMPDRVQHDWDGRGACHAQAHNVYGMQMARATAEGMQALQPEKRTFVFTRSAWAGLQRYAINWMGDNISTWEHARLTMPMVANLGLCGLAFTGPDTGGFAGDCRPELLVRWLQLGVFTPFLRNHACMGTADQEPWAFGEPYESINRQFIELRYHLLPYIYTAFWQCAQTGMPMLRPLFLQWQGDSRTHTIEDEFMFGDALLIAPVVEPGVTSRDVYLPAGTWYDWWSGERYDGGQIIAAAAPLDRLPIYARAGSAVPGWPVMQYAGERPVDCLTLHVFPSEGDSALESVLYEDDGATLAYQHGAQRLTRFTVGQSTDSLTITRQAVGPFEPGYREVELVVHGVSADSVTADGEHVAGAYDSATRTLRCRAPLAQRYSVH
jgi:alpha-glucosidase